MFLNKGRPIPDDDIHGANYAFCKFHVGDPQRETQSEKSITENVGDVAHVSPEGNPSKKARTDSCIEH
ncbi:unnamed protein product [Brassica napus]|uniref:(rape) hypothetical protein n=1 Tax=Brassica napus TaxID=3708 RepID=A0A816LSJ6_BRANA|nr:unnamed protein product [Brassica napus]